MCTKILSIQRGCPVSSLTALAATVAVGCLTWATSVQATPVNFGFNTTGDGSTGWTFSQGGSGSTGDGSPQSPSFYFNAQGNQSTAYEQSSYATASAALGSDPLVQGTYTITFITAPTAFWTPTAMDVTAFDANKSTQLGTLQYTYNPDTTSDWQTVNFSFSTTAANVGDYLALQISAIPSTSYGGADAYWFGVDTITGSVVAVPEPASMSTLGVGALLGLLMLRRRRVA